MTHPRIRCVIVAALFLAASVAIANPFSDGNPQFRATSSDAAAIALAQSYLNAVGTGSTPAPGWTLYEFNSDSKQDYLSVIHTTTLRTVPEPGVLTLLCIAVLSAWGIAMRRQQTA